MVLAVYCDGMMRVLGKVFSESVYEDACVIRYRTWWLCTCCLGRCLRKSIMFVFAFAFCRMRRVRMSGNYGIKANPVEYLWALLSEGTVHSEHMGHRRIIMSNLAVWKFY